jgi:hypothetical protein
MAAMCSRCGSPQPRACAWADAAYRLSCKEAKNRSQTALARLPDTQAVTRTPLTSSYNGTSPENRKIRSCQQPELAILGSHLTC